MDENKNPVLKKKELTDENLEQVNGGVNLPLNMGANGSSSEATSSSAAPNAAEAAKNSWISPAGMSAGAAILIGGAWAAIDHQQPHKSIDRHMPTPTHEIDPRSR